MCGLDTSKDRAHGDFPGGRPVLHYVRVEEHLHDHSFEDHLSDD